MRSKLSSISITREAPLFVGVPMDVWSVAKALALWLAAFLPSSIAGSAVALALSKVRREHLRVAASAIATQVLFASLSIAVPAALGMRSALGLLLHLGGASTILAAVCASIALVALSLAMNLANDRLLKLGRSQFARDIEELLACSTALGLFTLLAAAPIGEELLFRGLLEGALMASGVPIAIAVLLPASLFAAVHAAPFSREGRRGLAVLLLEVFVVGLVISYVTAVTRSLAPAIASHAAANGGGLIAFYATKRASSSHHP